MIDRQQAQADRRESFAAWQHTVAGLKEVGGAL